MIKTIKELLIEWWAESTTTKMPIPTIYTYEVNVDGRTIHIESMSRCRIYIHYKARKRFPDAKSTSELLTELRLIETTHHYQRGTGILNRRLR